MVPLDGHRTSILNYNTYEGPPQWGLSFYDHNKGLLIGARHVLRDVILCVSLWPLFASF